MIESADFTLADNWHGGFCELALELADLSDVRLETALGVLWPALESRDPVATGCPRLPGRP